MLPCSIGTKTFWTRQAWDRSISEGFWAASEPVLGFGFSPLSQQSRRWFHILLSRICTVVNWNQRRKIYTSLLCPVAWTTNRTGLAALPNARPTSAPLHGPLPISNQSTSRSEVNPRDSLPTHRWFDLQITACLCGKEMIPLPDGQAIITEDRALWRYL